MYYIQVTEFSDIWKHYYGNPNSPYLISVDSGYDSIKIIANNNGKALKGGDQIM